jgi:hypothetical protein
VIPSAITTSQCHRDHGNRSSLVGTQLSTVFAALPATPTPTSSRPGRTRTLDRPAIFHWAAFTPREGSLITFPSRITVAFERLFSDARRY